MIKTFENFVNESTIDSKFKEIEDIFNKCKGTKDSVIISIDNVEQFEEIVSTLNPYPIFDMFIKCGNIFDNYIDNEDMKHLLDILSGRSACIFIDKENFDDTDEFDIEGIGTIYEL